MGLSYLSRQLQLHQPVLGCITSSRQKDVWLLEDVMAESPESVYGVVTEYLFNEDGNQHELQYLLSKPVYLRFSAFYYC